MKTAAAALMIFTVACADDYEPTVICHNSNCIEPTNPEDDSTIETLVASLELFSEELGRPPIDGMEIDTFWWGEAEECLMAHDLDHPERAVSAFEAVDAINQALRQRSEAGIPLTRRAERYTILIELKGHVTESKEDAHDEEQLAQHADCGVVMGQQLIQEANDVGYDVEVVFMSFAPALLEAIYDHPEYDDLRQSGHVVRLSALRGIPRPLDIQTVPIDEYPDHIGIDLVSAHPHWTRDTDRRAYEARDWEVGFWMFNIVPETLRAIEVYRPAYITTSEAEVLAGWLERQGF